MFTTIAYQTLEDKANNEDIIQNAPYSCLRKDAWLGNGYYFWDNNLDHAHAWGQGYTQKGKNYIICELKINIPTAEFFDLHGNTTHINIFKAAFQKFQNGYTQRLTVAQVINSMRKHKDFDYSAVRASDMKRSQDTAPFTDQSPNPPTLNLAPRIQICIFLNKEKCFELPVKIIFPPIQQINYIF